MSLFIVPNPACGANDGHTFVLEHVLPVLEREGDLTHVPLFVTERPGHAGEIVIDFLTTCSTQDSVSLILSSGDGTLHEIINAVTDHYESLSDANGHVPISIALIPSGTANALYSSLFPPIFSTTEADVTAYKLKSVKAFLAGRATTILNLANVVLEGPSAIQTRMISCVVASIALHAMILRDSEALRKTIPDLSRFKVAAGQNIRRWFKGTTRLLPLETDEVLAYDDAAAQFVSVEGPDQVLEGPVTYLLSTVNVDRLEPHFVITPLQKIVSTISSMEVVIIRPMRDGAIVGDSEADHMKSAETTYAALTAAYANGAHVKMRYDPTAGPASRRKEERIVEYFRSGGWMWTPDTSDELAHFVCVDGAILKIEQGGRVICTTVAKESRFFRVFV